MSYGDGPYGLPKPQGSYSCGGGPFPREEPKPILHDPLRHRFCPTCHLSLRFCACYLTYRRSKDEEKK